MFYLVFIKQVCSLAHHMNMTWNNTPDIVTVRKTVGGRRRREKKVVETIRFNLERCVREDQQESFVILLRCESFCTVAANGPIVPVQDD